MKNKKKNTVVNLCMTALFTAMVIALSSFGIPVPGGNIYLCDMAIYMAAILLNPVSAFVAGGIGTLLGDMIFYPVTMFVSLIVHGLQALVVSLISRYTLKKHPFAASCVGIGVGGVIMFFGYVLGKTVLYGTFLTALAECPYDILQTCVGGLLAMLLCYKAGIKRIYETKLHL